jgi:hypothetical protein
MLERPPPRHPKQAARKARYRDRLRRGVVCPQGVEVSAIALNFLIATCWLHERDAADPIAIGRSISALLEDSARRRK